MPVPDSVTFPADCADARGEARPGAVVDALFAIAEELPVIDPADLNRTVALSFVNPVPVGQPLKVRAWSNQLPNKPVHRVQIELFADDDLLVVRAHLTIRNAKPGS